MREDETADGDSDSETPSSTDDLMEEMLEKAEAHVERSASEEETGADVEFDPETGEPTEESLAEVRAEAIGAFDGDRDENALASPDDRKGGRQPTDVDAVNSDVPDYAKRTKSLGDHSATEDMSVSETRALIDEVSTEHGHMSGNHGSAPSQAPGTVRSRHYADGPGDGSVDGELVERDAATPNHFETQGATRVGDKQGRGSESGSDGLDTEGEDGWSDTTAPLDDRANAASPDTDGMNSPVDYEELARHNDGRSAAWSADSSKDLDSGVGGGFSEWAIQEDKTSIAETYCQSRLELTPLQTQRVTGIIESLDFDKFGRQKRLENVTLAAINAVVDINHYEHLEESEGDEDDRVNLSAEFKELRESQDMSLSDLKKLTEKVREQL
jgi:hypothetical protein